ncbi:MAG: exonuclease SbcCD subunit D [Butyrivibrio sp.]|nr:exonuclease SbcCD subunit D [Butyrivibrio sp.]
MKIIHLADLHIGKVVRDFSMIEDQKYFLDQIVKIAEKEKIDAVLIAGDVYDRTIPPEDAVRLFDDFIYKLTQIKTRVLLISGNHDSDERLNFGSRLFVENGVYFCTKFNGQLYKASFEDEFGPINFYLLPFVKASQVRHFYPDEEIDNYDSAVRCVINNAKINKTQRNIILSHQFVAGKSGDISIGGSESLSTKNVAKTLEKSEEKEADEPSKSVGLVECIGYDCFDDFDYVALGHIHKAQRVGRDEIRYAGAPLKYHADETGDDKSVPIVTFNEKGNMDIELRHIKPLRDMRCIKGPMKQLLDKENVVGVEDYIFVVLTDNDIINDAMTIFRQTYPRTMQIRYENDHTRELEMVDPSKFVQMRSFSELITDFYKQMYNDDISEEEMEIMKKIAGKAGIENETN